MNRRIKKNKATIFHVRFCCKLFVPTCKALAVQLKESVITPLRVDNRCYSPVRFCKTTSLVSKNRITADMSSLLLSDGHTSTSMKTIISSPIEI